MASKTPPFAIFLGCLALLAVGFAGGCQATPGPRFSEDWQHLPEPVGPGLVASLKAPVSDLPMPVGFVMIESDSSMRQTQEGRLVHQKYQGQSTVGEALTFYQQHLPLSGWSIRNSERTDRQAVLEGVKAGEALELIIRQEGRVTSVLARIWPRQTAAPQTAQPTGTKTNTRN